MDAGAQYRSLGGDACKKDSSMNRLWCTESVIVHTKTSDDIFLYLHLWLLDIAWNIPLACCISCVGTICQCLPPDKLDTRSKARRPIKVGIKGRGRSGTSRDSNPAGLCCSSAHLVQCEPDKASSFTNPNVGPGTYAGLWLELDSKV